MESYLPTWELMCNFILKATSDAHDLCVSYIILQTIKYVEIHNNNNIRFSCS